MKGLTRYKLCSDCGENKPYGCFILTEKGERATRCTDCIIEEQKERYEDMKILG